MSGLSFCRPIPQIRDTCNRTDNLVLDQHSVRILAECANCLPPFPPAETGNGSLVRYRSLTSGTVSKITQADLISMGVYKSAVQI